VEIYSLVVNLVVVWRRVARWSRLMKFTYVGPG